MGFSGHISRDADSRMEMYEDTSPMSGIFILETPVVVFDSPSQYRLDKEYRNAILSFEQVATLSCNPDEAIVQARFLWGNTKTWSALPLAHLDARRMLKNVSINVIRIDREF